MAEKLLRNFRFQLFKIQKARNFFPLQKKRRINQSFISQQQHIVAFPKIIDVYKLGIIFSYWYWGISRMILKWDAHTCPRTVTSAKKELSRLQTKLGLTRRPQTAKCRPVEACEALLRREVRYQRGESFVAVRALRSFAQLWSEEEKRGKERRRKKKKKGGNYLLSTLRAVPKSKHVYLSSSYNFIRVLTSITSILSSAYACKVPLTR